MKRLLASIFALLFISASLFAQDAPARRYLVSTRGHLTHDRLVRVLDAETEGATPLREYRNFDAFAVELTEAQAAALQKQPDIRFVEPDPVRYLTGVIREQGTALPARKADSAALSNDGTLADTIAATGDTRDLKHQVMPYGVELVHAPKVWPVTRGAGIKVGIIDTGIDAGHPELIPAYRGGWDTIQRDDSPVDGIGHGSHVAGTIAAADNDQGVVGVAPDASIYAIRVFSDTGRILASALMDALDWAISNHMNVLNLSLGGPDQSVIENESFQRAADAGILVFASSGNGGDDVIQYPAGYQSVIAIGAVDSASTLATFSTRGSNVKFTAPGVSVLSTVPRGKSESAIITAGTTTFSGLSMDKASRNPISGQFVFCDLGKPGDFPSSVSGKIALIKRGDIAFADKVKNAMAAGATSAIIYNKEPGSFSGTLCGDPCTDTTVFPSVLSMSQEDGEALRALPQGTSISTRFDDYDVYSGTSMACPHAVAVAALVWSLAPSATAADIRDALITTAHDLGAPGWDSSYGYGLIDAYAAAKRIAPEKFVTVTPRRRPVRH